MPREQTDDGLSFAPKITVEDAEIVWTEPALAVDRRIRACTPGPGAWSTYGGEDRDLCHRWRHHGYRMRYVPEAVVYHAHPLSLRTFWRQHFNYGKGAFHFRRHRARREMSAFRLEPLSFYLGIPRIAWSAVPLQNRLRTAILLLVSQGANAAGFLTEWFRTG